MAPVYELTTIALRLGLWGAMLMLLAGMGTAAVTAAATPPPAVPAAAPPNGAPVPAATGTEAAAQFVAQLAPGLWEYRLTKIIGDTGEPQTLVTRHCGNPSDEIRQNLINIDRKGCRFSETRHRGNRYESSWTCAMRGATATFHSLLTVMNDHSYRDESEMRRGQQVTYSTTFAIRVGTCPAPAAAPGAAAPDAAAPAAPVEQPPPTPAK